MITINLRVLFVFLWGTFLIILMGCQSKNNEIPYNEPAATNPNNNIPTSINYLALGDSYTIGEGVEANESWPIQLSNILFTEKNVTVSTDIIAQTGITTNELLVYLDNNTLTKKYDLVTIQIGVNNQVRGDSRAFFEAELILLLNYIKSQVHLQNAEIVVVSLPDWGATPFGSNYDRSKITQEINAYNNTISVLCGRFNLDFIDITPISRSHPNDPSFVTYDGLHPSALMYTQWVEKILPRVIQLLNLRD